jgi:hypothetical protein
MILIIPIIAIIAGAIIYFGCRMAARLHTEDRTPRLRRGLVVIIGAAGLFLAGDLLLSRSGAGDGAAGALLFTIPLVIASVTGLAVGLHLLLGGPRGEYLP